MADYVQIHKGAHKLSVSRKAFNAIYKEKGFALEDGEKQSAKADASHRAGSKSAGKKKSGGRSKKGSTQSPESKTADAESGADQGSSDDES
jgi:hypothetical protein